MAAFRAASARANAGVQTSRFVLRPATHDVGEKRSRRRPVAGGTWRQRGGSRWQATASGSRRQHAPSHNGMHRKQAFNFQHNL